MVLDKILRQIDRQPMRFKEQLEKCGFQNELILYQVRSSSVCFKLSCFKLSVETHSKRNMKEMQRNAARIIRHNRA